MFPSEKVLREIDAARPTGMDTITWLAIHLDKIEKTTTALKVINQSLVELTVNHNAETARLNKRKEEIQKGCVHFGMENHRDPSGGSDHYTQCPTCKLYNPKRAIV